MCKIFLPATMTIAFLTLHSYLIPNRLWGTYPSQKFVIRAQISEKGRFLKDDLGSNSNTRLQTQSTCATGMKEQHVSEEHYFIRQNVKIEGVRTFWLQNFWSSPTTSSIALPTLLLSAQNSSLNNLLLPEICTRSSESPCILPPFISLLEKN